jgi:predicted CXXCH cytochrome family protein
MKARLCLFPLLLSIVSFVFLSVSSFASSDEECMACHQDPELKNSKGKSCFIDYEKFRSSIHGQAGISCVSCHSDLKGIKDFPHPEKLKAVDCGECHGQAVQDFKQSVHGQAKAGEGQIVVTCADCHGKHDIRAKDDYLSSVYPLNIPQTCESCHLSRVKTKRGPEFVREYEKSVHFRALKKAGLTMSANCSNCHGSHKIKAVLDSQSLVSRKNIIRTCGKCHVGIERDYLEGVHGKDYEKGIEDVPVCTDCHNEHNISSPQEISSAVYATKVAAVCSRCHEDETLARKYGFLTGRLKTYLNSFHGIASKFGETRVANCASCHGFHDIRPSFDPKSSINPNNLPKTCGKCHPGAGINFARGKIHVTSEKKHNKWAYFVKIFYVILIASIIFIFLVFIVVDLAHRLSLKWKSQKAK